MLALEVGFDREQWDPVRLEETPGYNGWLRIPGSMLWDDVGAMLQMQTQHMSDLWPLAKDDREKIYRHPIGPVVPE